MKKFKIVEEGRILTNQELAQVQGGSNICISTTMYRICGGGDKVVCNGVITQPCVTNHSVCSGTLKVCGEQGKAVCGGSMAVTMPVWTK